MNAIQDAAIVADAVKTEAQEYYEENGYYVYRDLIPQSSIDSLLASFKNDIAPAKYPFFRQSTNNYEVNKFTDYGYVKQSFLDIHDYKRYPEFSQFSRDIFTSKDMQNALSEVTGFASFNLMQTMMFDANTATQAHQDCWYLDTVPNGHLLAAWIALEDIDERAGRFYVLPKSQRLDFQSDTPGLSHTDWLARIRSYLDQHPEQVYAPALKKGDVLFWNSHTIHGALPTQDPSFSRKSLTAHYMPSHFEFGNLFMTKQSLPYKTYNGMKFYRTQEDYTVFTKLKTALRNTKEALTQSGNAAR